MSIARKCDRCGKLYEQSLIVEVLSSPSEIAKDWWRDNIRKDNHPYEETKIDLCESCQRALADWIEQGGKS